MRYLVSFSLVFLLSSCQIPQWRVAQKEVPKPITKNSAQIETDRQAAALIAKEIKEPRELKPIAENLSSSLGLPDEEVSLEKDELNKFDKEQRRSITTTQNAQKKQNEFLEKYQGKDIEGTGVNLFGPSAGLLLVVLAFLGIASPPVAAILFFLLRRAGGALRATVSGVESYIEKNPTSEIKEHIADEVAAVSDPVRQTIRKIKAKL